MHSAVCSLSQAEKAVAKFEETGGVLGDLGMSLIRVGKFESEDGTSCGAYSASAAASRSIAADTTRVGKVGFCFGAFFAALLLGLPTQTQIY